MAPTCRYSSAPPHTCPATGSSAAPCTAAVVQDLDVCGQRLVHDVRAGVAGVGQGPEELEHLVRHHAVLVILRQPPPDQFQQLSLRTSGPAARARSPRPAWPAGRARSSRWPRASRPALTRCRPGQREKLPAPTRHSGSQDGLLG